MNDKRERWTMCMARAEGASGEPTHGTEGLAAWRGSGTTYDILTNGWAHVGDDASLTSQTSTRA
jgi:hypothetical protein